MDRVGKTIDDLRIDRSSERGGKSFGWWPILVPALLLGLGVGVWLLLRNQPVQVSTQVVQEIVSGTGDQTVLNASGYVVARREATVSSKVTGKVVEVLVEEGMRVEEGQILARLDASNVSANLKLAEAQLDAARAALAETQARIDEADKELRRLANLYANRIATQAELDHAEAEVKSLKARLERQRIEAAVADRQVAVCQQQMEDMVIRAPFSGIAVSKNAQPGEMISPVSAGGGFTRTGIGTIVDMNSLEIEVDVNESYLNRVQPGQPVEATLDAYPDWKIPCRVLAIIPTADRQKATVKVRVRFDQLDPRILPQMGVKVAFRAGKESTVSGNRYVLVSKRAVRRQDGRDVVWVVNHGRIERRAVTLGNAKADDVVVLAGLAAGEKVVVEGPENLKAGDRVREAKP
jgi:RND family efflux transporter MFP subunit